MSQTGRNGSSRVEENSGSGVWSFQPTASGGSAVWAALPKVTVSSTGSTVRWYPAVWTAPYRALVAAAALAGENAGSSSAASPITAAAAWADGIADGGAASPGRPATVTGAAPGTVSSLISSLSARTAMVMSGPLRRAGSSRSPSSISTGSVGCQNGSAGTASSS